MVFIYICNNNIILSPSIGILILHSIVCQLHQIAPPGGGARVSFPSPCITGTRQLTDQSSTSHPSSPPSPSPAGPISSSSSAITSEADPSLKMLKQYYLDCILKIDPNHPVGQSFPNVSFDFHQKIISSIMIQFCSGGC